MEKGSRLAGKRPFGVSKWIAAEFQWRRELWRKKYMYFKKWDSVSGSVCEWWRRGYKCRVALDYCRLRRAGEPSVPRSSPIHSGLISNSWSIYHGHSVVEKCGLVVVNRTADNTAGWSSQHSSSVSKYVIVRPLNEEVSALALSHSPNLRLACL